MRTSRKIIAISLAAIFLAPSSAQAVWFIDDAYSAMEMRRFANQLFISGPSYFGITVDEVTSTPQSSGIGETATTLAKYAVLIDGVIDKIVTWDGFSPNDAIDKLGVIVRMPDGDGVKYVDANGVIRLASINHGDIVSEQVSPTQKVVPNVEAVESVTVVIAPAPTGAAVPNVNSPVVVSQSVAANNSTTMVIAVPTVNIPPSSTISIQVVADGRSGTSIGVSQGQSTVTVTELPQNQNVSASAVITNTVTNTTEVITIPVVATPVAPIVIPPNARDEAKDRATIAAPYVVSTFIDSSGHRVVEIKTPVIPDYDTSKTNASLQVVGPGGSTTAIGLFGTGETLTIGALSPTAAYVVKIVIRDLGNGKENVINGESITKGITP